MAKSPTRKSIVAVETYRINNVKLILCEVIININRTGVALLSSIPDFKEILMNKYRIYNYKFFFQRVTWRSASIPWEGEKTTVRGLTTTTSPTATSRSRHPRHSASNLDLAAKGGIHSLHDCVSSAVQSENAVSATLALQNRVVLYLVRLHDKLAILTMCSTNAGPPSSTLA